MGSVAWRPVSMPDNWKALQAGHHVSISTEAHTQSQGHGQGAWSWRCGVQVCALLFLDTLSPSLDSPDPKCLGPT